jgi:hypothetical protein
MDSKNIAVTDVFDSRNKFEITLYDGHDMFVNTTFVDMDTHDFKTGQASRIYNWAGSPDYDDLHRQLKKALHYKRQLTASDILQKPNLRLEDMQVVTLTDKVGDKSALTLYRDEAGYMGFQTESTEYPELATGPIVWVCAPVNEESAPAMKRRATVFLPVFDLVKPLAEKYNRIQKIRDEERKHARH